MNLNEQLRQAYEAGRRQALNEQGLPGGIGPDYWNDPPCVGCYWYKGRWYSPAGTPYGNQGHGPLPKPMRPPLSPDYYWNPDHYLSGAAGAAGSYGDAGAAAAAGSNL